MQVLKTRSSAPKLEAHELFFVELWYGMTHDGAMDSHRVRCMNSRTIVRELNEELEIGLLAQDELKGLCAETLELLERDGVIQRHFAKHLKILAPLLKDPPAMDDKSRADEKKKPDATADAKRKTFRFAVADLNASLGRHYFEGICIELQLAMKPGKEEELQLLTGSLLTDLVDRGWTLEALYRWHKHFVIPKPNKFTFADNLVFMLRQFAGPAQPFSVTMKLTGSDKLHTLGKLGAFDLSQKANLKASTAEEKKFCRIDDLVTFAQTQTDAGDHISAAILAREKFEEGLDLLRFNFERAVLKIEEVCFVKRCGDGRIELPSVRHSVPNPVENLSQEGFQSFVNDLNVMLARRDIDDSSRERLASGIRHYRFGRDADGYKDKFLNWWMGLEILAGIPRRDGGIGPTVIHNARHALVQPYLFRLLRDLLATLKYCKVAWPADVAAAAGCTKLEELDSPKLLALLHNQAALNTLWQQCQSNPVVPFRGRKLAAALGSAKDTAALLKFHHAHLLWHIGRLYRIRCCIVHGSPIRFRLALLAANLEFYLKELILYIIDSFRRHPHVTAMDEIYNRAELSHAAILAGLEAPNAGNDSVVGAMFNSLVIQETEPAIAPAPAPAAAPAPAPAPAALANPKP